LPICSASRAPTTRLVGPFSATERSNGVVSKLRKTSSKERGGWSEELGARSREVNAAFPGFEKAAPPVEGNYFSGNEERGQIYTFLRKKLKRGNAETLTPEK